MRKKPNPFEAPKSDDVADRPFSWLVWVAFGYIVVLISVSVYVFMTKR